MTGIAPKTLEVFKEVTQLSCIKEFVLVGGTALSIQIHHRLSEDLDFCKWVPNSNADYGIAFHTIDQELKKTFAKVTMNPIGFDQTDFVLNGSVKMQFFNEVGYRLPSTQTIPLQANLRIAPIEIIAAMKIKTMFQRNAYRDYYDVFSIVKGNHVSLEKIITNGCRYDPKLQPSMIVMRLRNYSKFREEKAFGTLAPAYEESLEEIGKFFETETARLH